MNASEKQVSDKAAEGRVPKARATKRRAPAATAPKAAKKPNVPTKPPAPLFGSELRVPVRKQPGDSPDEGNQVVCLITLNGGYD